MTPEELRRSAILVFGERGWMSRLAEALAVDRSTVSRWFAGLPAPGPVIAAVEAWLIIYLGCNCSCRLSSILPPGHCTLEIKTNNIASIP